MHMIRANPWDDPDTRFDNAPGPCRVLMQDGKWLVPPAQRPKLPEPPREETRVERRVSATIPANGWMGREGR